MKHLTDEQLNLELCKWLGWTRLQIIPKTGKLLGVHPLGSESESLPDHMNDLSSLGRIALIEAKLTDEQRIEYIEHLIEITVGHPSFYWSCRNAKPRDCVTAILLTVNPEVFK